MTTEWPTRTDPRFAQIEAELGMLRLEHDVGVHDALLSLADLTGASCVVVAAIATRTTGLALEHWRAALAPPGVRELVDALLGALTAGTAPAPPVAIEPRLRNRAFDLGAWLEREAPSAWLDSPIFADAQRALGHPRLHAAGALVYDGPTLLGWFGGLFPTVPTATPLAIFDALVPVMQRRFAAEQRLRSAAWTQSVLDAALAQIGGAAFLIGARGAIHEANPTGRALLATHHAEIADAIAAARAERTASLPFELYPVAGGGALAILRASTPATRITEAVAAASARWHLTPRQHTVLELVVRGFSNGATAESLGITERTVELHVTAILDRAGADNRATLVSRVLA